MLISDISDKPEPYSSYKNRVFSKHIDKLNNQLRQIKDCSLRPEDKARLKTMLREILNEGSVAAPFSQTRKPPLVQVKPGDTLA